jgi:pyocin large subunit-like protein
MTDAATVNVVANNTANRAVWEAGKFISHLRSAYPMRKKPNGDARTYHDQTQLAIHLH